MIEPDSGKPEVMSIAVDQITTVMSGQFRAPDLTALIDAHLCFRPSEYTDAARAHSDDSMRAVEADAEHQTGTRI